jgi:hypothetical protein
MSNDNLPHRPGRLSSLRNVVLRIEQEAKLAGSPHSAIELVLCALRCGEIHALGVYAGERARRSVAPAEWNALTIEIAPQQIFEVNGPPTLVVRRRNGAPGDPPAVLNVHLDAQEVRAWQSRLRQEWNEPQPPPAPIIGVPVSPPADVKSVSAPRPTSRKRKWQGDRLDPVLKKLYPPDGKVPEHVSTARVYQRIAEELKDEKNIPSRDTVARKLGRKN